MSLQQVSGSFSPPSSNGLLVLADTPPLIAGTFEHTGYSTGATRTAPTPGPTLVETWNIIGWTIRLRMGIFTAPNNNVTGPVWIKPGDVWVGLTVDKPLTQAGGANVIGNTLNLITGIAQLPPGLATFSRVVSGEADDLRQVALPGPGNFDGVATVPEESYGIVADTFLFPAPVKVKAGAQLQMAVIWLPSLMQAGWTFGAPPNMYPRFATWVGVYSAAYSVLYETTIEGT